VNNADKSERRKMDQITTTCSATDRQCVKAAHQLTDEAASHNTHGGGKKVAVLARRNLRLSSKVAISNAKPTARKRRIVSALFLCHASLPTGLSDGHTHARRKDDHLEHKGSHATTRSVSYRVTRCAQGCACSAAAMHGVSGLRPSDSVR
jgi:hypothetical protein